VTRVDPERRQCVVSRLRALREAGNLTTAHIRMVATGLKVTERTVWRWIGPQTESSARPPRYEPTRTDQEAFAYYRGNVAALARARAAVIAGEQEAAGVPVPDHLARGWAGARQVNLRTLQRAFARRLTAEERAAWKRSERLWPPVPRDRRNWSSRALPGRNQVWEVDHRQLPVLVQPLRGPAVSPCLTTVLDVRTRALLGWSLSPVPHAGTVLTALRTALVHDRTRGPFGGVPSGARLSESLEFATEPVRDVLAALCVACISTPSSIPLGRCGARGTAEGLHRSLENSLLRELSCHLRPCSRQVPEGVPEQGEKRARPMRVEDLARRIGLWAGWYNTILPHPGLGGLTPLRAWEADRTPLERIDAAHLRHLMILGGERMVTRDGVRFNGQIYSAPVLRGLRGRPVRVRYMPHDGREIEVYLGSTHLCTAARGDRQP
jgi:putative transposase